MNSVYERDHVLVEIGDGGMADDVIAIGHNFEAVLADLETRMREAAADLNFEEAARLRDEVKRLRATELAVVDDPTAKQRTVQGKAGAYAGTKKYGDAANLPVSAMKKRGVLVPRRSASSLAPLRARVGVRGDPRVSAPPKSTNPTSTKCTARNPCPTAPTAPNRASPRLGGGSKIFQPTDSRQSGPEFGPAPRSTGGAPGHRGGWKKR